MLKYIETAVEIGILDDFGIVKDAEDKSIKRQKVVLLSGSQGEFRGTVRRVVSRQDKKFKLKEDDKFIFSSKAIPGNEKKLAMLYNDIIEQGAQLITANEKHIHVSGHPGREDLKVVYENFKPTHSFPIHGESLFLKAHVDFVLNEKLSENSEMMLNGDSINIAKEIKLKENPRSNRTCNLPWCRYYTRARTCVRKTKVSDSRKYSRKLLQRICSKIQT
ncbi:MBL fold metallo-hydrolase [Bacteriovorax sp. DB6_IX]|uniref:MBL fold metallo-hydrolase n=1 Tax=Bacteriovorax sp. DB6_IX TaxID=1353530 RepID=UPI00038A0C73|nr:MBL fold metallo-hydrolase [Bacteriovorax sp. DB6_IX]EQC50639.1 RNA-metabolizing metallo-beta-lactamase [Bacteriovorax sp. DB6_IX]